MPVRQGTGERLVRAARELLEEEGYAAASVTAIAGRAGVSAGALYRHFPSKAELFVQLFRETADREVRRDGSERSVDGLRPRHTVPPTGSPYNDRRAAFLTA
jgi:AcrR family transcriptional regulator